LGIYLPLTVAFILEVITLKPLIPQKKLYLAYEAVSLTLYLALIKLHTIPLEKEHYDLRQGVAKSIYLATFAVFIGELFAAWKLK
jgi:hypothetical protein